MTRGTESKRTTRLISPDGKVRDMSIARIDGDAPTWHEIADGAAVMTGRRASRLAGLE